MNKEYVIEPSAFHNAIELKYALEKFGFSEGRLLVKYPSAWFRNVYEHIQLWPDLDQHRAKGLLDKARKMAVSAGHSYEPTNSWLDNAHNRFDEKLIDGVIASDVNSWGYPTLSEIDDDYFDSGRGIHMLGSAKNYTKISRRLLQMSHEVAFIDRFLHLNKKNRKDVITDFLKTAQLGKCRSFVIWTSYDKTSITTEMLNRDYKPVLIEGSKLVVKLVDDAGSAEEMHTRLMLSKLGGIRFDVGFEDFRNTRNVDIMILDKNTHDYYCKWYLDPGSRNDFKVIERHEITG